MATLVELSKAVRPYDPEDKRQRNSAFLPGVAAGGAAGTGYLAARDAKGVADMMRKPDAHGGQYRIQVSLRGKGKKGKRLNVANSKGSSNFYGAQRLRRGGKNAAAAAGLAGLAAWGYGRAASKKNRRWE